MGKYFIEGLQKLGEILLFTTLGSVVIIFMFGGHPFLVIPLAVIIAVGEIRDFIYYVKCDIQREKEKGE